MVYSFFLNQPSMFFQVYQLCKGGGLSVLSQLKVIFESWVGEGNWALVPNGIGDASKSLFSDAAGIHILEIYKPHQQADQIYQVIRDIASILKDLGYIPHLSIN